MTSSPTMGDAERAPRLVAAKKAPRADARRNRERVLAAADAVFAARGVNASTEEIAREAGVGIGTVFRHFPTKELLLEAVIISRLEAFAGEARVLADDAEADAGEAFFPLFARAADQSAAKFAATAALNDDGIAILAAAAPALAEVRAALDALLIRAQAAGAVRRDVGVDEVIALLVGATRAAEYTGWNRALLERTVAIFRDGLRPPGFRTG